MIIPPVKLVEAGRIVPDVFALILAQIRSKHETGRRPARADRGEQRPACGGCRRSSTRHGRETIAATMDELLAYTERRTRAELAALPHGVYEAEGSVDTDGYTDEPVRLAARVEIARRRRALRHSPAPTRSAARRSTRPTRRRSRRARTR